MAKKKKRPQRPVQSIGLSEEFIDRLVDESRELDRVLSEMNGLDLPSITAHEKLKALHQDLSLRLALAEDCIKKKEAWKIYIEKARGLGVWESDD